MQGLAPSFPDCKRRFPRFRYRNKNQRIALEHRQTLPSLPRARAWIAVYVTDIGRGGVGFLHGEALYPKERMRIVLPGQRTQLIEIVRCQRVGEHCFSIGARFVHQS